MHFPICLQRAFFMITSIHQQFNVFNVPIFELSWGWFSFIVGSFYVDQVENE